MTIDQILKLKWFRDSNLKMPHKLWGLREEIMRYLWQIKPTDPAKTLTRVMLASGFLSKRIGSKNTHYFEHKHTGEIISFNHKDLT